MRPEAAMRQHAMEANAYTQDGEGVHGCKQYQVEPVHSTFPEQGDGQHGRQKRDENNTQDENLIHSDRFHRASARGLEGGRTVLYVNKPAYQLKPYPAEATTAQHVLRRKRPNAGYTNIGAGAPRGPAPTTHLWHSSRLLG